MEQLQLFLTLSDDGRLRTANGEGYVLDTSTYDAINRALGKIVPRYNHKLSLLDFTPEIVNALLKQGFKIHIVKVGV